MHWKSSDVVFTVHTNYQTSKKKTTTRRETYEFMSTFKNKTDDSLQCLRLKKPHRMAMRMTDCLKSLPLSLEN